MKEKTFFEKVLEVQQLLKAPKGQVNKFGNYRYRSAEDILESVKPLLHERGLMIICSDEVVLVGDKNYVKATAQITDGTSKINTTAYARESVTKKGMDDSQITGSTSSYARKYALNGLLAIDDTKDADSMDNREPKKVKLTTNNQRQMITDLMREKGSTIEQVRKYLGITESQKMTYDQAVKVIKWLKDQESK